MRCDAMRCTAKTGYAPTSRPNRQSEHPGPRCTYIGPYVQGPVLSCDLRTGIDRRLLHCCAIGPGVVCSDGKACNKFGEYYIDGKRFCGPHDWVRALGREKDQIFEERTKQS